VASACAFSLEENQARTRFPLGLPIMNQDLSPFGLDALNTSYSGLARLPIPLLGLFRREVKAN
jgi:hypothetical protein